MSCDSGRADKPKDRHTDRQADTQTSYHLDRDKDVKTNGNPRKQTRHGQIGTQKKNNYLFIA